MAESVLMILVHKSKLQPSRTNTMQMFKSEERSNTSQGLIGNMIEGQLGGGRVCQLEIKLLLVDAFKQGTLEEIPYVVKYRDRVHDRPEFKIEAMEL